MATTKDRVRTFLREREHWQQDRFGHFTMEKRAEDGTSRKYRMKLGKLAMRLEVRIEFADGRREWHRVMSGYYKRINLTDDGKIEGMTR